MKFYEIAQRYFPHPRNSAATQQLRRWIQADPQLRKALKDAGVRRGAARLLSPPAAGV